MIGWPSNPEKVTSDASIVSRCDPTSATTAGNRFARLSASVDDQNASKSAGSSSGGRYARSSSSGRSTRAIHGS